MSPLSAEEVMFPLPYATVVHKDFGTFERLFRANYTPPHVYCIHVGKKTTSAFTDLVRELLGCISNAFLASKRKSVVYLGFSRLQADLNFSKDLSTSQVPWKYVPNTCGQEFPLRTKEIAQCPKGLKGKKNLPPPITRTKYKYLEQRYWLFSFMLWMYIPYNLTIYFGSAY